MAFGCSDRLKKWLGQLADPNTRRRGLMMFNRYYFSPAEAPWLWAALQKVPIETEICKLYPLINPPILSFTTSTDACCYLKLLRGVITENRLRDELIVSGKISLLNPFLAANAMTQPIQDLKMAALQFIDDIVRREKEGYLEFAEIIPFCLMNMEEGSEKLLIIATKTLRNILWCDLRRNHVCEDNARLEPVLKVLAAMLEEMESMRVFGLVISCYHRLVTHNETLKLLMKDPPKMFQDHDFLYKFKAQPGNPDSGFTDLLHTLGL